MLGWLARELVGWLGGWLADTNHADPLNGTLSMFHGVSLMERWKALEHKTGMYRASQAGLGDKNKPDWVIQIAPGTN